jgi:hypothetical protein
MARRLGLSDHCLLPEAMNAAGELDQFCSAESADSPGGIDAEPDQRRFDGARAKAQTGARSCQRLPYRLMRLEMLTTGEILED